SAMRSTVPRPAQLSPSSRAVNAASAPTTSTPHVTKNWPRPRLSRQAQCARDNVRIVGIETEYGIADASGVAANPILMSSRLVNACRLWADGRSAPWDYGGEDPLQDQRGHRRDRATAGADMLTDAHEWNPQHGLVSLR